MRSSGNYQALIGGEARPVDVAAIEHELTQMWKAAAVDTLDGHPVVRTAVMNLISFAPDSGAAERVNDVVSQVSERHPSRSIVIVADGDHTSSQEVRASISAHCRVAPDGGPQMCSEQVNLLASAATLDELHGTILPLLVPDLPVVLWWLAAPDFNSHLLSELIDTCDRLIVDSAGFAPPTAAATLAGLQRLLETESINVGDLNWSRLTPWRELIAQFFDSQPARRYLDRITAVRMELASVHHGMVDLTEGLLLSGWLASRLGWTLDEGSRRSGEGELALRAASGPIDVRLAGGATHSGEGIYSVTLSAARDATFSVRRTDAEGCAEVQAAMPETSYSRVVNMQSPPDGALLSDELELLGGDTVFEEALSQAVRFVDDAAA